MQEMILYQRILESNLINFIIMITILTVIFKKAKLGAIFDKMAQDIKTSVMSSSEAAQAALKEYKEAKRSTKDLEKTKSEIIERAKTTVQNAKEAAKEVLLKEEKALLNRYQNKVESDTIKAKIDTSKEFLDVIIELSKDEIQNRLNGDKGAEIQAGLIDKCIEKIDEIDFSKRGGV